MVAEPRRGCCFRRNCVINMILYNAAGPQARCFSGNRASAVTPPFGVDERERCHERAIAAPRNPRPEQHAPPALRFPDMSPDIGARRSAPELDAKQRHPEFPRVQTVNPDLVAVSQ